MILVDDKYPENLTDVLAALRSVTTQPIRYLLNSHHHGDHVSGNVNLAAMGIDIIAHRRIRENFLRLKQPGAPNIVFEDQGGVFLGGVEVRMHHLGRGHTNGNRDPFPDLRAIHMGDLVIDGMPVIDYAGGGSAVAFVKTIDNLLALDFDIAIPGHGKVMTRPEGRLSEPVRDDEPTHARTDQERGAKGSAQDAGPGARPTAVGRPGVGQLRQHNRVVRELLAVLR